MRVKSANLLPFLAALSLIVGCSPSCRLRPESHGEAYARVHTDDDLRGLALALESLTFDLQANLSSNSASLTRLDLNAVPLFHLLSENPVGESCYLQSATSYQRWISSGSLVDRWGSPFNHQINRRKEVEQAGRKLAVLQVTFWSSGPDCRNNRQHGDDIVGQPFEITLPEELVPADCQ